MCRTILSRFINSSTHRTAIIVIHHHGQELIHDLDFHLPAQSDSAIDCCDVHRDASPECKWSLWDWHISPSEPLPVSSILSKFVSSIWVARVQQDEAHNMSHPSSWSICWWCWCIVVFCIIPSALYLLPRHKISFDHDHSINGRRSSSILLICQLTTLSACWDHPYISSSIILLDRLLQSSKSWARENFISTAPKWHVCSQQAIILLWP